MERDIGVEIRVADSIPEAVRDADIVICATSSKVPVLNSLHLKPGAHVNTVCLKTLDGYELGLDIADAAKIIVTDSVEQTRSYASPFFLAGTRHGDRIVELSDIIAGRTFGRRSVEDATLFCSVGLAGTEVAVASAILDTL
jgi:ornithine cyclodeaminase